MSDAIEHLVEGFAEGLNELPQEFLINLSPTEARSLGQRIARSGLPTLIRAARLGETLNTSEVSERLHISRQALAKRLKAGTILGIAGRGTTHYPIWQFEQTLDEVRPEVREVFKIFAATMGSLDAFTVSSWMTTPSQDLEGLTPLDWLIKRDEDLQPVLDAARRTALRLAS
jgi:hypothetical protein